MPFTDQQFQTLAWIGRVSSFLSVIGVLSTFSFFYKNPKSARNPTARLIIFMAVGDLMSAVAKSMGRWPVSLGTDQPLCQFQAVLMQEGDLSSLTWTAILAANLLYVMFFRGRTTTLRRYEVPLAAFAFGWPLIIALLPLGLPSPYGRIYGDTTLWCWITSNYKPYELGFFYMILWTIVLFQIGAYALAGRYIWNTSKALETMNANTSSVNKYRMIFIRTAACYLTASIVVWLPSSINRVYRMSTGETSFGLSTAQTVMSPLRGFVNFLAYFLIYRLSQKKKGASYSPEISTDQRQRSRSAAMKSPSYKDNGITSIELALSRGHVAPSDLAEIHAENSSQTLMVERA
ncbi:uncharacterized protein EV422DRAFT_73373 [Fimicolochytrium jonesii]|uniref:uncharacterized protein n=1 Tax=Fimicolochytrium jonesii TaxID=1396493 RepID=UPI0022FDCA21|nr:uncharacterized protein EV422DRAFT_73373 [Fimicolochytrium jonesii]KAI8820499.1 hypothetical protein EV422DRAFT_73373 [Fimicolochytrium jonesii]